MNKIALGLLLGAVLGALDGATSWFTPEVRAQLLGIIAGSTFKGIIAGVAAGWFAKKVQNMAAGIVFGLVVGALLAYGIVLLNQGKYFLAIMLPGSCVGAICGWATQRYGDTKNNRVTAGAAMALLLVGLHAQADTTKAVTAMHLALSQPPEVRMACGAVPRRHHLSVTTARDAPALCRARLAEPE